MPHELSSAYFLTIQLHLFVYFLAYSPGLCLSFSLSYLNTPHSLGGLGLWRYWYLCLKCLPLVASTSFSYYPINTFVVVQSLSRAQFFATPWTAACLPSLSFTIFLSLLKLKSFELVMPSNHLILCHPLLLLPSIFPSISVFSSESAVGIRWPKYWSFRFNISPSMNTQDWSPLGWTGWMSLHPRDSQEFSPTPVQKHQFFGAQLSL